MKMKMVNTLIVFCLVVIISAIGSMHAGEIRISNTSGTPVEVHFIPSTITRIDRSIGKYLWQNPQKDFWINCYEQGSAIIHPNDQEGLRISVNSDSVINRKYTTVKFGGPKYAYDWDVEWTIKIIYLDSKRTTITFPVIFNAINIFPPDMHDKIHLIRGRSNLLLADKPGYPPMIDKFWEETSILFRPQEENENINLIAHYRNDQYKEPNYWVDDIVVDGYPSQNIYLIALIVKPIRSRYGSYGSYLEINIKDDFKLCY